MLWPGACIIFSVIVSLVSSMQHVGFGTKTSYLEAANMDNSPVITPGCEQSLFWFLARHGTRSPSLKDLKNMRDILPGIRDKVVDKWRKGQGRMEEKDISYLINWVPEFDVDDIMILTRSGQKEHKEMGGRWRDRLGKAEEDDIEVRVTTKQRAVASAEAFLTGFLGTNDTHVYNKTENMQDHPNMKKDNKLLRFYDNCPKYQEDVKKNKNTYREMEKFLRSEHFEHLAERVRNKTGANLTIPHISLVWQMCRFDAAWYPGNSSSWCSVFTYEDLKIFEFLDDLKYYYKDGHAHNITAEMTQPLFSDIINRMKDIRDGIQTNKTVLNFAHEETVLPFLTALGLYEDEKDLLASDWPTKDHLWKTSTIGSFGSNIGILVLKCENNSTDNEVSGTKTFSSGEDNSSEEEKTSEENSSSEEDSLEEENSSEEKDSKEKLFPRGNKDKYDWKIMMFHQEYQIVQPLCEGILCGMNEFIEEYNHLAKLDFNKTCATH